MAVNMLTAAWLGYFDSIGSIDGKAYRWLGCAQLFVDLPVSGKLDAVVREESSLRFTSFIFLGVKFPPESAS